LVLALDCDLPWLPARGGPRNAVVYYIDVDPLKEDLPLWEIPALRYFKADSLTALTQLHAQLDVLGVDADEPMRQARQAELAALHTHQRDNWRRQEEDDTALTARSVARALHGLLEEDAIVVDEAVTNSGALCTHLPRNTPGTFYSNGGTALGWGLGAAMGVKLAAPQQTVVAVVGDGSYIFGAPTAAYWTARHANAPFLTVILNNGGWNATKQNALRLYPDGAAARADDYLSQFEPSAELARVAEAAGGALALTVSTLEQLTPALSEALAAVRVGRAAAVDVRLPAV
jgi:acetolactate synthase-1/2/3 large subunit